MPKWLKNILDYSAGLIAFGYVLNVIAIPLHWMMGWRIEAGLWLIPLIPFVLHRLPIMLGEFIFIRPQLNGTNVNKELFKINIYVFFGLFFSSIISTAIFFKLFSLLAPRYIWPRPLLWGLITCIASLVAMAEVYIKNDYFMEKHLTTNPKKVTHLLSVIIISVYLLSVAGGALYLYSKKSPIIFHA